MSSRFIRWILTYGFAFVVHNNREPALSLGVAFQLTNILRDVGEDAGLAKGLLSFENLRWASALRDWRENEEPDDIRQKLGLSKITWRETKSKLEKLVQQETAVIPNET